MNISVALRQRRLVLCAVALLLALLLSLIVCAHQGLLAHADDGDMSVQAQNCVTSQNPQFCMDPVTSGCSMGAESLLVRDFILNGVAIGHVDLRSSPTCNSFWIRAIVYASACALVASVLVAMPLPSRPADDPEIDQNIVPSADGSLAVYSNMSFGQRPSGGSLYGQANLTDGSMVTVLLG